MPKQPASSRSTGHVTLTCGLLNAPVSIYPGTVSEHGIKRRQFVPVPKLDDDGKPVLDEEDQPVYEDHSVGNQPYDKETGETITEKAAIVKKIQTEYGFVYVEDDEIEDLFTLTPNTLEVKEFQPQHLFYQGHYVPKSLNYIEPTKTLKSGKKVPSAANIKVLSILLKAMKEEGVVAVCELTTRGIPKPVILLPNGTLWEVYHTDALREQRELPEVELNPAEVEMARSLVQALSGDQPLDLTDKRSELIQNFADEKARKGDFGRSETTEVQAEPKEASADFLALMQASVEAAKAKRATG